MDDRVDTVFLWKKSSGGNYSQGLDKRKPASHTSVDKLEQGVIDNEVV